MERRQESKPGEGVARARALAAAGVLSAAGPGAGRGPVADALAAAWPEADAPCAWRPPTGPPDPTSDLADAWTRLCESRGRGARLRLETATGDGTAEWASVASLWPAGETVAGAFVPHRGACQDPSPLARPWPVGVLGDATLLEELREAAARSVALRPDALIGEHLRAGVLDVGDTPDAAPARGALLIAPRLPAEPAAVVGLAAGAGASCLAVLEDPRAPLELTARHLWPSLEGSSLPALALVPLNRRQLPEWVERLGAALQAGSPLDAALWAAAGRFGPPPLLVATGAAAGARLAAG